MKVLLWLVIPVMLVAQSSDSLRVTPVLAAPPVIVMVPEGRKVSVLLLATGDIPTGTSVLPVVTVGKARTILSALQISGPGVYPMATAPIGAEAIAYVSPPVGKGSMYTLRSTPIVRGYQYDGQTLAIYGDFTRGQTLVYVGTSLVPVKPTLKSGYIELTQKPTGAVTPFTVYQAGGVCDSVLVRLK